MAAVPPAGAPPSGDSTGPTGGSVGRPRAFASSPERPLERFVVEREVGRGAAGIVFRAHDRETDRAVALKVVAMADADEVARARFLDEGELLSAFDHPGIVKIVAYGTLGDEPVEIGGYR